MVAQVAEDALAPALANRRVQSCLHVMDDVLRRGPLPAGAEAASERVVFLCPLHPERLLCDAPGIDVLLSQRARSRVRQVVNATPG